MVMNRWTRLFGVFVAITFHLGIITFLTLWTFGIFLIALDVSLVGDEEYRMLGRLARTVGHKIGSLFGSIRALRPSPEGSVADAE
jgi:hypothetical protein